MPTTTVGPPPPHPPPQVQALDLSQTKLNLDTYEFIKPSKEQLQMISAQLNATLQFESRQDNLLPRQPGARRIQLRLTRANKRGQCDVQIKIHSDASSSITEYRKIDINHELLRQVITTAANLVEGCYSKALAHPEEARDYFDILDQVITDKAVDARPSKALAQAKPGQDVIEIIDLSDIRNIHDMRDQAITHQVVNPVITLATATAPNVWQIRFTSPIMLAQCVKALASATTVEQRDRLMEEFCIKHNFRYWQMAQYFCANALTLRKNGQAFLKRAMEEPYEICSTYIRTQWYSLPSAEKTPAGRLNFCNKFNICPAKFSLLVNGNCKETTLMKNARHKDAERYANMSQPSLNRQHVLMPVVMPVVKPVVRPVLRPELKFVIKNAFEKHAKADQSATTHTPAKVRRMYPKIIEL